MIDFKQFVKDLDGPLLRDSKTQIFKYTRGANIEQMRYTRVKFGNYRLQIATGWSPEVGQCSIPANPLKPFSYYSQIYCTIMPDNKEGQELIRILCASPVWKKFIPNRITYAAHLDMEDFYEIYKLICKTQKLAIMI